MGPLGRHETGPISKFGNAHHFVEILGSHHGPFGSRLKEDFASLVRVGFVRQIRVGPVAEVRVGVAVGFGEVELHHGVVVDHQLFFLRELDFEVEKVVEVLRLEQIFEAEGLVHRCQFHENLVVLFAENNDFLDVPEPAKVRVNCFHINLDFFKVNRDQHFS